MRWPTAFSRGGNITCWTPRAQIPVCAMNALGSDLGQATATAPCTAARAWSSRCEMPSRPRVRRVRGWAVVPSTPALGSTDFVASCHLARPACARGTPAGCRSPSRAAARARPCRPSSASSSLARTATSPGERRTSHGSTLDCGRPTRGRRPPPGQYWIDADTLCGLQQSVDSNRPHLCVFRPATSRDELRARLGCT